MNHFLLNKSADHDLNQMLKTGGAFQFVSNPFERSKAVEIDEGGELKKYIEFYASSDQIDLAGDCMELSALEDMVDHAPGTIMLRDHDRSTDKIFGSITHAELITVDGKTILRMKAFVDDEDVQNVRIWKSIKRGVKIGASVTVVILDKKDNPRVKYTTKDGVTKHGLLIVRCKLLEVSIVTIPCNQDSWTLAATASKALHLSRIHETSSATAQDQEHSPVEKGHAASEAIPPAEINPVQSEETMSIETQKESSEEITAAEIAPAETAPAESAQTVEESTAETAETIAAEAPAATVSEVTEVADPVTDTASPTDVAAVAAPKSYFPVSAKTVADIIAANLAGTTLPAVVSKGLFNDILNEEPTLYKLFDILNSVRYTLLHQKWALEAANVTEFGDILASWNEALSEFEAAAVKSFLFWGRFDVESEDVDDVASYALDLEKSFLTFAEAVKAASDEDKPKLAAIGQTFIETAKSIGIPLGGAEASSAEATQSVTEDVIRKSAVFQESEQRLIKAETDLNTVTTELEVAKTALETALEVNQRLLGQPLQAAKGK